MTAKPATGDPVVADPLASPAWRTAEWADLVPAMKESGTVPRTRVASVYGEDRLYVAFAGVFAPGATTTTSVWLDTSTAQNGTEVIEIVADAVPPTTAALRSNIWHRCVIPPEPRETPHLAHPMTHIPNVQIAGLVVEAGRTTLGGEPAWTVVYAIPLKALPAPLRTKARADVTWRVQLLRHDTVVDATEPSKVSVVQSNLSPVVSGAQAVMPYRMAPLVLSGAGGGPVAARPGETPEKSPAAP